MMTNTEVVKSFYKALDKGQSKLAFSLLADDFTINQAESLPYGGVYEGKDELALFFEKFGRVWSSVKSEDMQYFSEGELIIVKHEFLGTSKSGKELKMPMVQFYWVKDGEIHKAEPFYKDTQQILEFINSH